MNCKHEFDREFLIKNVNKTFVNTEYKQHRRRLLLEREKSLLPATQPHVEQEIRLEALSAQRDELLDKINQLQAELGAVRDKIYSVKHKRIEDRRQFVRKCPGNECQGFLSTRWACSLCNTKVCPDCHEIRQGDDHMCIAEDVESAKLIAKEARACPTCGVGICKVEGCDQMWCVMCHTAFSWKTGRIETTTVHNPHFFEWQRRTNGGAPARNLLDVVQCGREITNLFIHDLIATMRADKMNKAIISRLSEECRSVVHVNRVDLHRLAENVIGDNLDLRIKFMRNRISEEDWKRLLEQRATRRERNREVAGVLNTFVVAATDILYRSLDERTWLSCAREIAELRTFVNNILSTIATRYNCKEYRIPST